MQDINTILPIIYPLNNFNIILANGQFPQEQILLQQLNKAQVMICCDGAINTLSLYKFKEPDYIIGDCDSISDELLNKYQSRIITVVDQSKNDLTKATELANKLKLGNIVILGATGLREDHTLANIALLTEYYDVFSNIAIISDYGIFTVHSGDFTIKTIPHQQISFFTIDTKIEINAHELKWPLNKFKLNSWQSGTLNEATHDYLNIQIGMNQKIIIYRAFCVKSLLSNAKT